jgi:SpoIID/LytB domain protein
VRYWVSCRGKRLAGAVVAVMMVIAPAVALAPRAAADSEVTVTGHGFGHGRGMGQWGAFGYATQSGWSYQQITDHYYGGTTLGTRPDGSVTVRVLALDGAAPIVTSGAPFVVGGNPVAAGSSAKVALQPNGSWLLITSYNGCNFSQVWSTPISDPTAVSTVADPGSNVGLMLSVCEPDGSHQYRGSLHAVNDGGTERTVNAVDMEQYVRDVVPRESPASWGSAPNGMEALKAQAVAARSYGWAETRWSYAKTCDNSFCQVYGGAGLNGASLEDPRSDAATTSTTTQVRVLNGSVARTEFSSSTGGYTAGGTFAPVPDAGDVVSPYHDWSTTLTGSAIAAAYGLGTFQGVAVIARNGLGDGGGRVLSMQVQGSAGTVTTTGDDFASRLGLRSDWFFLSLSPLLVSPAWLLRDSLTPGVADLAFTYGNPGDVTISCDWAGNGVDSPAVFRSGVWYVRLTDTGGTADANFGFGQPGDVPVCGDWAGTGKETPGVYRGGVFYLRNSLTTGVADAVISYGVAGDIPLSGRWKGGPVTTVGVYRPGNATFYLRNSNTSGVADEVIRYGDPGDLPLVGDWNGDRVDSIGVFRRGNATWYLRNSNTIGTADVTVTYGIPSDTPITGDWIAAGRDTIGVVR